MTPSHYLVFSQRPETSVDLEAWSAHAARFFGCTLEAGEGGAVVVRVGEVAGSVALHARPREPRDLALADAAEARVGGGGLAGLARRCPVVWEVAREGDGDASALRVAAVLASVLLGPIVEPEGPEIFGVKTARGKLEVG